MIRSVVPAEAVVEAALLGHRQRGAGLQIDLGAETVRTSVGSLAVDHFKGFKTGSRERVQRRGAAVATHARRGHAVDHQSGRALAVRGHLATDRDVVDQVVVVRRKRNTRKPGQEFTDVLGGQHAPLVERDGGFDVGRIALLGDG